MTYDVVVVGGGIGGLTVGALLATRGLKVCLFERQSQVGGCIARVEFSNYEFDPGMGLYTGFGEGELFEQFFSELKAALPKTTPVEWEYVVRLSGDVDVRLFRDQERFATELERTFPECKAKAIDFYRRVQEINSLHLLEKKSEVRSGSRISNFFRRRSTIDDTTKQIDSARREYVRDLLSESSTRLQRFIDAQLRSFIQTGVDDCDLFSASIALGHPLKPAYEIEGGPSSVVEQLVEVIKSAGSTVRLNTSVLRIAWDDSGRPAGVDLLSGETVHATRAIISNMTIWDTYGKLIGLNRTPTEIKSQLSRINSTGVYLIYATLEANAVNRIPSANFLVAEGQSRNEFTFATRGSNSNTNLAVTIKANCEVEPWFAYQASEEDAEQRDQEMLESLWGRVHQALPELGSSIEIIETANPRTFYDQTRRKLGMVMGIQRHTNTTPIPPSASEIYPVGDTVSNIPTLYSVVENSIHLANQITK